MNTLTEKILDNVYYLGVNDRQTDLFENMWPLPEGVSYNAYMILDEKNALLDTVKVTKADSFIESMQALLNGKPLDYLVIHHMEPDHSGCINLVLGLYPNVKFVGNAKTKSMMRDYLEIEPTEENFIEVKNGDVLDLGNRKLTFTMTPMVHWPESMVSYEPNDKILFSQDIFGGFGCSNGTVFDDQINYDFYQSETRRYYSNIVGKYSGVAKNALNKLLDLEINIICPVHGFVWRQNPSKIIEEYRKWANFETEEGVVIVFGSMYGNTEAMADYVAKAVAREGIKNVKVFDVSKTHASYILNEIWKYKGLILGSCTYNNSVYPVMYNLLNILKMNKLENHVLGIFGSYGWSGGAIKDLKEFAESGKFDNAETVVEAKGISKEEDLQGLAQLAKELVAKVKGD